jgi:hypothetical protein
MKSSSLAKVIVAASVGAVLSACGNAYETLNVGEWESGGSAIVPEDLQSKAQLRVTILDVGQGPEIRAGSLVHARVAGKIIPGVSEYVSIGKLSDVWFWLGDQRGIPGHEAYKWGELIDLGSRRLRAAFVGARAGSRVSIVMERRLDYPATILPTRGFVMNYTVLKASGAIDTRYGPEKVVFHEGVEYEFTIMDVCQGRLLYRQATKKEWGYIPHVWAGSRKLPFEREGVLEWVAMEADCDSPKDLRLEMGPGHRLSGTLASYLPPDHLVAPAKGKIATRK